MGKTSNAAKQAWNDTNYAQVKVSIDPGVAAAFKASCASAGISMAKVLTKLMAEYSGNSRQKNQISNTWNTRQQRRKAVKNMLDSLEGIKQAEEAYADNIPDNLRGSVRYEAAEQSIEALSEAIELLIQAY